ncbi:MAG: Signal recognition particle receptor FtsY [Firmicutes bacterium ADurb.Bin248]|jgi:fused signal recognition particle receptor|nr:MAG: Signal recognition particle receptor FtsY [Firmicutes bacterium ADurb.Bin248]HOF99990.1 signal recognition particle-docking protein FtsY [Clostridia bacterium]HPK14468.1 signal recognition particle-docking protein FtsY [Clostridia bacterium]
MEGKKSFLDKLKGTLRNTGGGLLAGLFRGEERINAAFFDELEEAMIVADMGVDTSLALVAGLREAVDEKRIRDRSGARAELVEMLASRMRPGTAFPADEGRAALLIVGVNGVGKTTSIGKLAHHYVSLGRKPMVAAADTFRAAAAEQLTVWAERANVPIVKHKEGADPAAVVFDAAASFKARGCDILLCDTAGRLHNKKNLMNELSKIRRVIERELPGTPIEALLVLDASTGQNAIAQARAFMETTGLTGVILTKLDGTAKGGMAVAIRGELGLPVRFVGVGEGIEDLQPFDADAYAGALV